MGFSKTNSSAATLTKNRTDSVVPTSGMCSTCIDGCIGMCEIGKSAYRGAEMLNTAPDGIITSAGEKTYPIDYSHFNIMGTCTGADGIEKKSDKAIFPNVKLETRIGHDGGIKLRIPFILPALGAAPIVNNNWEGLAIGAAIAGVPVTTGDNTCGMDPKLETKNGKVVRAPALERKIELYKQWQQDGYGRVIVQSNVEDTRLGAQEYAIEKLGVDTVELKWGQGAKNIGGGAKIDDLKKAQMLKKRGYIILPDPLDEEIIKVFEDGILKEFVLHLRVEIVEKESFLKRVEKLRNCGARYIFLKTGAYRPLDLAKAVKYASEAKIDLLTVDAAGGGAGVAPWRMMNESGVPPVELHSLLYRYADQIAKKDEYVPDIAIAGGFTLEDQIFKGLALGAPYFKAVAMARAPLAAAMVGKTIGTRVDMEELPVYIGRFGTTKEEIFVTAPELKKRFGSDFDRIPTGALGIYTYYQRISLGLKQLMAGSRKFALKYIAREDIASLTKEAAEISGIHYMMDIDKKGAEKILNS